MAGKRKRVPGIYERVTSDGRTVFDVAVTVDGRKKWVRGFPTKGAARDARDELRVQMRRGQVGRAPARLKLGDYIEGQWWPYVDANLRSRESARAYRAQVNHVVGFCRCPVRRASRHTFASRDKCPAWTNRLGEARLTSLNPLDVEAWKASMRNAGVGAAMQNAAFDRLRQALNLAVQWELIWRNPCQHVAAPAEPRHDAPVLSNEDISRLLDEADATPFGALFYLVVMTGLRWSEVTKLQWADVDFATGALRIPRANTKTDAGRRFVALGPATLERLRAHRMNQMRHFVDLGGPPPQYVFTNAIGGLLAQANFHRRVWDPLRRRVGFSAMHFHDLRHLHSTLLARAGVHPSVMAERLGHASALLSLEVYTDLHPQDQAPAALAVEGLVARSLGEK